MGFSNVKRILNGNVGWDRFKLLLLMAKSTRPRLGGLCSALLQPFFHDGELSIRYRYRRRNFRVWIRASDEASDTMSVMELAVRDVYELDPAFNPDLVVDGGGNIGLFSLAAAATYPLARIVICEPVHANVAQIQRHLRSNNVDAEVRQVCIGGGRRTIPFYVREANQGSFDPARPYVSSIDIQVLPLKEIVGDQARCIFIKLDIEGMEMEALDAYVPGETRAVSIAGELHDHKQNKGRIERIFSAHGWHLRFEDESDEGSLFFAKSPAATRRAAS